MYLFIGKMDSLIAHVMAIAGGDPVLMMMFLFSVCR